MKKTISYFISLLLLVFFLNENISFAKKSNNENSILYHVNNTETITRTIDASKTFREFPALAAYWNTSIQKAPAPIIGDKAKELFGKAKIVRCWLNLDEMWDYRTRQFDFNFKIGVDKYKNVAEKHRETWDWEVEAEVNYYDYLNAFSQNSEYLMLNIRRYARDVLDGKLPISKDDWKMIFKTGLKHYKERYSNIRYVEVTNEYTQKTFMNATSEEYYQFYKLSNEAINEINEELQLSGEKRILIGGPVIVGNVYNKIEQFLELYNNDQSKKKCIDFISWHDYHQKIEDTAEREQGMKDLLIRYHLPENLSLFMTEHNPFHFPEDKLEYHYLNTAYLPKSLYFASIASPNVKIFPWVLYHNKDIQTKFMWFSGPNESDTKENEIKLLPLGCSMKFLSMLEGKEIQVKNSIDGNDLVLATSAKTKLVIEAINYKEQRDVKLNIANLNSIFQNRKVHLTKYLLDSKHSNCLTDTNYPGGIEKIEDVWLNTNNGNISLEHKGLEKNGVVFWKINK